MTWNLFLVRSPCTQKPRGAPVLMGPAGCKGHVKSWSQCWSVTPKSSVWALSLACSKSGCSAILVLQPTLTMLRVSHQTTPGGAPTIHNHQALLPLSKHSLGFCGQNPTGKPRVKPRQTPFLEGHALCPLTRTPGHIHSQAVLGRGDPVFSPKH